MDFHGFPWISIDFYGFPWISVDFHRKRLKKEELLGGATHLGPASSNRARPTYARSYYTILISDIILFVLSPYFNINSERVIYTLRGTRPRRIQAFRVVVQLRISFRFSYLILCRCVVVQFMFWRASGDPAQRPQGPRAQRPQEPRAQS